MPNLAKLILVDSQILAAKFERKTDEERTVLPSQNGNSFFSSDVFQAELGLTFTFPNCPFVHRVVIMVDKFLFTPPTDQATFEIGTF